MKNFLTLRKKTQKVAHNGISSGEKGEVFLCCPFLYSILISPMKSEKRQTAKSGRKPYDSTEKQCIPKELGDKIQNIVKRGLLQKS